VHVLSLVMFSSGSAVIWTQGFTSILPLEPCLQPFLLWLFWRWDVTFYLGQPGTWSFFCKLLPFTGIIDAHYFAQLLVEMWCFKPFALADSVLESSFFKPPKLGLQAWASCIRLVMFLNEDCLQCFNIISMIHCHLILTPVKSIGHCFINVSVYPNHL
jgi:hypothetical protein